MTERARTWWRYWTAVCLGIYVSETLKGQPPVGLASLTVLASAAVWTTVGMLAGWLLAKAGTALTNHIERSRNQ